MGFRPIFEKGLILKQNMLEALRDYPIDFIKTLFWSNGNGIISGLDITISDDHFTVSPGIAKINGEVFFLTERATLEFQYEQNYVYLEIETEMVTNGTFINAKVIQQNMEIPGLFEIFRYVRNAAMTDYLDISEIYNGAINRIDQSKSYKSIKGGSTLCDKYYELFAKYVLKSPNANAKDTCFAYQCLNGIDNMEIVREYFQSERPSNDEIILMMKNKVQSLNVSENFCKVAEPERQPEKKMIIS